MKILNVQQGSPEWHAARAKCFTASEAPAMMGASKYLSRSDLLKQKATGIVPEVDAYKQALFDAGHDTEKQACAIVEEMIGEILYPIVATDDAGRLLASYDGQTMDERIAYEHKLWNEDLAAQVRANELEPHYYWQLEQQLLVSPGTDKIIFVVSNGTREKFVYLEYRAVPGRAEALVAGWAQFEADLKAFVPTETAPAAVAAPIKALPSVSVQVSGQLSVTSNLATFGAKLQIFIEQINKKPETDQDFADCEAAVKVLEKAEDALNQAETAALAQVACIDDMRKVKALYYDLARTNRLMLEKLIKAEKENRKTAILNNAKAKWGEHIAALNEQFGKSSVSMPLVPVEFAGAMKGLKTMSSMQNAVDTELARAKIEANAIAQKIQTNLNSLRELAGDFKFLFSDTQQIVLKANDDLIALIKSRIADHKAEQEKKEAETREQIRREEEAKAAEKVKAEQEAAKAEEFKRQQQAAQPVAQPAPVVNQVVTQPAAVQIASVAPDVSQGAALSPVLGKPTMTLGNLGKRLGFDVRADFLRTLGFEGEKDRAAVLYHESDFPRICTALINHLDALRAAPLQQAA